jgi:hypothetical protein
MWPEDVLQSFERGAAEEGEGVPVPEMPWIVKNTQLDVAFCPPRSIEEMRSEWSATQSNTQAREKLR